MPKKHSKKKGSQTRVVAHHDYKIVLTEEQAALIEQLTQRVKAATFGDGKRDAQMMFETNRHSH